MSLKLSEAIRLGAMLKPQGFGELYGTDDQGQVTSCVVGAAFDGGYVTPPVEWELTHSTDCPVGGKPLCYTMRRAALDEMLVHLNDSHRWTREQIAAWVETIERMQEQRATEPQAVLA